MPDATRTTWLHRLRHTPMRDVVRGRFTGRLDWRARIRSSDVPAAAKALIIRVVKRTRLWSLEKGDVAEELVAHFYDGIESGAPLESLLSAFGDGRSVARLIRRAKRRNRTIAWHVVRVAGWFVIALLAVYALLTARFFLGKPAPSVDYIAILNRTDLAAPADERAWPLYREALLAIGNRQRDRDAERRWSELLDASPGGKHWPEMVSWLYGHQEVLETVRRAAEKPAMGFVRGTNGSINDPALWPDMPTDTSLGDISRGSVISVLLPHLNDLRMLASLLYSDSTLAREQGDGSRFARDITATLNLADQLRGQDFLITSLVSVGVRWIALDAIERTLTTQPTLLSDAQLQDLAHHLSGPRVAADLIDLKGERMAFYDAIQRMYTDNGAGDGRITPDGLRFLSAVTAAWSPKAPHDPTPPRVLLAAPATIIGSRADVLREYDRLMDMLEAEFRQSLRDATGERETESEQHLSWLRESTLRAVRYLPIVDLGPGLNRAQWTAERYLARRDAIVFAIALELYRRQHGAFPESLDVLTPALLPRVPIDRITGEPLHYRLVNGKALIYSVGADRDDDAGRVPLSRMGNPQPYVAAQWGVDPTTAPDGDWVLYPEPVIEMDGD